MKGQTGFAVYQSDSRGNKQNKISSLSHFGRGRSTLSFQFSINPFTEKEWFFPGDEDTEMDRLSLKEKPCPVSRGGSRCNKTDN